MEGRQPHPQAFCFLSAICITSFLFVSVSLAFAFLDAFLDPGQFLLQLVPVVFQAFPLLLSGEETAESRTASAPATTAGASREPTESMTRSRLTHRNHLLSGFLSVSFRPAVALLLVEKIVAPHSPRAAFATSWRSHSDVLKLSMRPRASRKSLSTV